MKVLVTYMTQTGNTKKIADAIYDTIDDDKEIKEIKEVDNLEGYDLAFIGFPIHQFNAPDEVKKFLNNNTKNKDIALFITHGAPEDFGQVSDWISKSKEAAKGANIVDVFQCQGEVSQEIMDMLQNSDDPQMNQFAELVAAGKGQPDETKVEKAKSFARDVITQKKAWTK
ncbi:MAG: flavodoxin family protein [Methanohalobium sp.]|uniref:flavodoxin family protein n=1 Tax=Methanohalobium sp. TaxID=2837493 RepID=UPI00397C90A1